MAVTGTIVSHDPALHSGLVVPDGTSQAIPFTEQDISNWDGQSPIFGKRVSFAVIQTPYGNVAVHVTLAAPAKKRLFRTGEWTASLTAPLLVAATTFALTHFMQSPLIISYLLTINFISFIMSALIASKPIGYRFSPSEIAVVLLAFCGGATTVFITTYLMPSRLREQSIFFIIGISALIQCIALKRFYPEVYDLELWRSVLIDGFGSLRTPSLPSLFGR